MNYGYARVSSQDQNLERQTEEFLKFGIDRKNIYSDKKSAKDFDRAAYLKLMRRLRRGDVLVVKSIDRLGRNYAAIIEEWHKITHIICADIVVLDMPLLDTRGRKFAYGQVYCRRGFADTFVRGRKRARKHTHAPGRGNCPCKSARSEVRQAEKEGAAKFLCCRARLYAGEKQSECNA